MSKSRKHREIFDKEPKIFAKPHPSEKPQEHVDSNSFRAKAAPLKRKSPPTEQLTEQKELGMFDTDEIAQSLEAHPVNDSPNQIYNQGMNGFSEDKESELRVVKN